MKNYCLPQDIKTRGRRSNNSPKQGHQADRYIVYLKIHYDLNQTAMYGIRGNYLPEYSVILG